MAAPSKCERGGSDVGVSCILAEAEECQGELQVHVGLVADLAHAALLVWLVLFQAQDDRFHNDSHIHCVHGDLHYKHDLRKIIPPVPSIE